MAQWVKCPTLAQVIISWFMSSSLTLGSVLTARSLEPASDSMSPSLSVPPLLVLCLSLSLSKINKHLGHLVAQSVEHLTSAQIMISRCLSSSPSSRSGLTAQSLEPASDSVSPTLSAPLLLTLLSFSLKSKIKKLF